MAVGAVEINLTLRDRKSRSADFRPLDKRIYGLKFSHATLRSVATRINSGAAPIVQT